LSILHLLTVTFSFAFSRGKTFVQNLQIRWVDRWILYLYFSSPTASR
jgi:hypothetical protein